MDTKQLSWKKSIKRLQISLFVLLLIVFYVGNKAYESFTEHQEKIGQLEQVTLKVKKIEDDISRVNETTENLISINNNKTSFIKAYNQCYDNYVGQKYSLGTGKNQTFKDCVSGIYSEKTDLTKFSDNDLQNIGIGLGVYNEPVTGNASKMNFDQRRVLYSLDRNIFGDHLERFVPLLSFSNPTLVNSKLKLYKVSFTFTASLNYKQFVLILRKLQNELYASNNLYYTINNISKFDVMREDEKQNINIQGNFYFTR